ncbi:MAG: DMT family transporter [Spirochaetaceae bacterium]|jgi:drug/metabolite transporter (DMT)-like permease|nr:DMT family transporter [Spirochaetaceae bacterium]
MKTKFKPFAAIIAVVITWGFSFLSTKIALDLYSPLALGLLRNGLAALFLIPLKILDDKRNTKKYAPLSVSSYISLALAGLIGVSFYFVCENNGLVLVSVSEAAIFTGAIPVLVMLCEWIWERIRRGTAPQGASVIKGRQWVGTFISIAGVALVSGAGAAVSGNVLGYLFMMGAMVCWVFYCFLTRGLFQRASYFTIVFWQTLFGFLGFIPFYILELAGGGAPPVMPTAAAAFHIVFLALGCSAFCFLCYIYALEKLGAASSSIFINLIPVVTVVAGFFLMGDRLTALQWAGAALTLAGVYMGGR